MPALGQPRASDPDSDGQRVRVPCKVVSRVRIPPSLIFEVIKAMNSNMHAYEKTFGPVQVPKPIGGQDAEAVGSIRQERGRCFL
jgi:hypothetical protein